jgi:hypothetical protein
MCRLKPWPQRGGMCGVHSSLESIQITRLFFKEQVWGFLTDTNVVCVPYSLYHTTPYTTFD